MKMQEFVKGQTARSRTVPGNVYEVLDVKAAEIMLKDSRNSSTRIFWAPRRNFEPMPLLDEELTEKVGMPVVVEPRLPGDTLIVMPEAPNEDEDDLVDPDAYDDLISAQESFFGTTETVGELPPGGATERDGHWTENVLTENPVEGRIHAGVSHADSLTELGFILANAMEAQGFGLDDADPESPHFNEMISAKLLLAVGELIEAQEELRAGHTYAEVYEKDGKPEGFAVEIADAIYRLLHLAAALGIDIGLVLLQKHEYNLTRPHKHGKRF